MPYNELPYNQLLYNQEIRVGCREGIRGWDKGDRCQGGVGMKSSTVLASWHKIAHPCKWVAGVAGRLGRDVGRVVGVGGR